MTLWVLPHIAWCVHGTVVSFRDVLKTVGRPMVSGIVAAAVAFGVQLAVGQSLSPLPRLVLEGAALFGVYLGMLLFVMGQKGLYLDLFRKLTGRSSFDEKALASA
jgi:hypothetical protein